MFRLEKSEALQRKIRQDDPTDLGIPTPTLARQAIQAGKVDEALELIDYNYTEGIILHDGMISFLEETFNYLATNFGEEEVEKVLRHRYEPRMADWLSTASSVREVLQRCAEFQRSHYSNITIVEEPDRYVTTCDPCGSGGRLRRTRSVEVTKKAYPWSWSKSGVPYYCTHCSIMWEIVPIELRGYPIRITLPGDRPEDPCIHLFYKKPELIPEDYFTRVGMKKDVSQFK